MQLKDIRFMPAALTALTACGTSSSGPLSFADQNALDVPETVQALIDADSYTVLNDLPIVGTANYEGSIAIGIGAEPDFKVEPDNLYAFGDMQMAVSLQDNTITGRADNFVESNEGRPRGFLDLNAEVDRDADLTAFYSTFGTLNGAITATDGHVIVVTSTAFGDFYDENGDHFVGAAEGEAAVAGVDTGFFGAFVLDQETE